MTGFFWFPVRSKSIRNLPCSAEDPPIGAQDSNQLSENWHPGNQESGNEQSIYVQEAPHRIPNWNPARSKVSPHFINQNGNFEKSQ
jgi:hypothetical protein